jgi:hypothetical protein
MSGWPKPLQHSSGPAWELLATIGTGEVGDRLRVLLVIGRPDMSNDVPFRPVARQRVRIAADPASRLELQVLRPATRQRLSEVLHAAADSGRPYHVVHFHGHGTYGDQTELWREQEADDEIASHPGSHGYLLFGDPGSDTNEEFVSGPDIGDLLAATQVPVLVLNACRSAYSEPQSPPQELAAKEDDTASGLLAASARR